MQPPSGNEPSLPAQRLGELLQRLANQGLNQAQVAKRAAVPRQYLNDVLNDHRPFTELFARRLADEFDVNFQWLLGQEDSPARPVLRLAGQPEKCMLPMIGEPIAGDPREHSGWNGALAELSGTAAAKVARAQHPYILQLNHDDVEGRLRSNDLVLVSQAIVDDAEVSVVQCGEEILLARRKRAKWLRVANGKLLTKECIVTGHCVGVVWSNLIRPR
jgi:transcriptional regulator with XRE-family HTH domain